MENRKGSGIFLGIIGVATLVVAIIGATFAYFSATASSADDAVTAESTTLTLGYDDVVGTNLKSNLIPASDTIAFYAANNQFGTGSAANQQCIDDNANEVCSVYQFTIGNPSKTTSINISGTMTVATNTFENLYFAVFPIDMNTGIVNPAPAIGATHIDSDTISLTNLNQQLVGSKDPADADLTLDPAAPSSYTLWTEGTSPNIYYNKRTYRIVIWIRETGSDQSDDVAKSFAAKITFDTGSGSGVTGVLAAAGQ